MKIGVIADDGKRGLENIWYVQMIRQFFSSLRHNYIHYGATPQQLPDSITDIIFVDVKPPIFLSTEFEFLVSPLDLSPSSLWREDNPCRQAIDIINEKTNKNLSLPTACDYNFILHLKGTETYEFLKQAGETNDYIEDLVNYVICFLAGSANIAKTWIHVAKSLNNEAYLKTLDGDLLIAVKHGIAFSKI